MMNLARYAGVVLVTMVVTTSAYVVVPPEHELRMPLMGLLPTKEINSISRRAQIPCGGGDRNYDQEEVVELTRITGHRRKGKDFPNKVSSGLEPKRDRSTQSV